MTEHLLGTLAVVGPIAGLAVGAAVGARRKQLVPLATRGYVIGCLGLVAYGAWTDRQWRDHYHEYVKTPEAWKRSAPKDMRELIDADTAELVVWIGTRVAMMLGIAGMFVSTLVMRTRRARGICLFAAISPVVVGHLWSAYNWHCRYDPVTGFFGLEKVRVLGVNFAMFIATGVAMGILWTLMTTKQPVAGLLSGSVAERPEPPSHSTIQQPNKET